MRGASERSRSIGAHALRGSVLRTTLAFVALALGLGCRTGGGGSTSKDVEFGMKSARAGLWNEAVFRWERALADRPKDPKLHNNLAVAYEHEGRYDEARKEYAKAMELDPEDAFIKKNMDAFENFCAKSKKHDKPEGQEDHGNADAEPAHAS